MSLTVSGAVTGAIFSLVAAGLVLSYTATGIFNFSYGAVAFASAFIFYQLNTSLHIPIVPAAALVILVFAPLLGLLLDVAVFRPLGAGHRVGEDHGDRRSADRDPGPRHLAQRPARQHLQLGRRGKSFDVTQVALPAGYRAHAERRLAPAVRRAVQLERAVDVRHRRDRRGRRCGCCCATPRWVSRCARSSTAPTSPAPAGSTSAPRRARRGSSA